MAFTLPDLPYAHDALAALGMSKETLEFHHDLHHKAYVDNGNKLIAGTEWETKSLEDVVKGTYAAGAVAQSGLFNNASQHWNHNLFWEVMGPKGKTMTGALEKGDCWLVWFGCQVQRRFRCRRCWPVRFGLGVAGQRRFGRFESDQDRKRREPLVLWPKGLAGLRCVGTFLLHRFPQQAPRLHRQLP